MTRPAEMVCGPRPGNTTEVNDMTFDALLMTATHRAVPIGVQLPTVAINIPLNNRL